MPLTEAQIKRAEPGAKPYKLADGRGLFLRVAASGSKSFIREYRFAGKRVSQNLGFYPEVRLAEARATAAAITTLVKQGRDPRPGTRTQVVGLAASAAEVPAEKRFAKLCDLYIEKRILEGIAWRTEAKLRWNLGAVCEVFGERAVDSITGPEVLGLIEKVQETGKFEKAKDMHRKMSQVFQFAAARGLVEHDPAHTIRAALVRRKPRKHPGLIEPKDVGGLMRAIRGYSCEAATKGGLLLSAYTALRSFELRGAEWSEIDFDARLWTVPIERMKKDYGKHQVPLSTQAISVLENLRSWNGGGPYVFQSHIHRSQFISDSTMNAALRRLGYCTRKDHCQHGFRTTFSTNLNEMGWNRDFIEKQLAHYEQNDIRLAYNSAMYLPGRTEMMQAWGDWLDEQEQKV